MGGGGGGGGSFSFYAILTPELLYGRDSFARLPPDQEIKLADRAIDMENMKKKEEP